MHAVAPADADAGVWLNPPPNPIDVPITVTSPIEHRSTWRVGIAIPPKSGLVPDLAFGHVVSTECQAASDLSHAVLRRGRRCLGSPALSSHLAPANSGGIRVRSGYRHRQRQR